MFISRGKWANMAKGFNYRGLGKYLTDLSRKCADAKAVDGTMKVVLYEGAGVYKEALIKASQRHGNLADGVMLSKMKKDDGWYIKLGYADYDPKDNKAWALKAATIAHGTSKHRAVDKNFIRRALKAADPAAQAAMDEMMQKAMTYILEDD